MIYFVFQNKKAQVNGPAAAAAKADTSTSEGKTKTTTSKCTDALSFIQQDFRLCLAVEINFRA